jgi:predicted transcriptional regulator
LNKKVKDLKSIRAILDKMKDSKIDLYQETGIIPVNLIAKAIEAFRLIVSTHVSAVPVVNDTGAILGCISIRHIREIANNASDIKVLYDETSGEFIKRSSLSVDDITIQKSDTMETAIKKLYQNKIHMLWIIQDNNTILGSLTVKHILAEMLE